MSFGAGNIQYNSRQVPDSVTGAWNGNVLQSGNVAWGGSLNQPTNVDLAGRAFLIYDTATLHPYLYLDSSLFQQVCCLGDYSNLNGGNAFVTQFGTGPYITTQGRRKIQLLGLGSPDSDRVILGDVELLGTGGQMSQISDALLFGSSTQQMMSILGSTSTGAGVQISFGLLGVGGAQYGIDSLSRLFTIADADLKLGRDNVRTSTMKPLGRNTTSGEVESLAGFSGNIVIPAVGTITVLDGIITNFV